MRVALYHGPDKPITVERVPDPEPTPDEVLVKIVRAGICGSDVSMSVSKTFPYPLGRFGHEYAGEIVEVGRNVSGLKPGDRIACLPALGCGRCEGCRNDNPLMCKNITGLSGGFGEYILIPPKAAVLLPSSLSLADGALVEPIACGLHALRLARMQAGDRILVLGAGAMALAIIYWARRLGAGKILAVSRSAHRSDVVMAMGADEVWSFDEEKMQRLGEFFGGPPDIVAECVGKPGFLNQAIGYVRSEGTIISMGMCMHNEPIMPAVCAFREIRLFFPLGYSTSEFASTARAFDSDRIRPDLMVSDVIGLEDIGSTMEALRVGRKSLKVQVDPCREPHHA